MRYFVVHYDRKSGCLCACHKSEINFTPQPQEKKSCRRRTQYSSTLFGCLCTLPIWCCPLQPFQMRYFVVHFDSKSCCLCAFLNSEMNFIPQPQEKKSCRRQTQCSITLCGCQCNQPIWCCPLKPIQMRYFVFHFWSKIMLLFLCLPHQQNEFHSGTTSTEKLQEANTMFQYYNQMLVHPTHLVLSSTTISNEIFCCSF